MHNNIMAVGSKDRPPMLAMRRYAQWQSRFLRYIDIRPNGDTLRKCILQGPYIPSSVIIPAEPATDDSLEIPERTTVETVLNISPENKAHYQSEKEAIHLLLTGIGDEIYLTVDASKTTHDMWIAIERLQQGESLNIQDVKTNLFWEFGKFTSHDGETMESHYSKFYKIMNEMYQKEVNEIRAERIAKNANPLALVVAAQQYPGKEIAKPITPPSELASEEDSDLEQAQRDKDMQKNLALIVKYFKKIFKPTNNNLRTSLNSRNRNVDTSLRYKNDNQTGHFGNQRIVIVVGARETVGSQVVQQTGIQCLNCKEFGHFAKECRKPKQAEQADWLEDTDEEMDEQELEAHYSYKANIQEVPITNSGTDTEPLEKVDSNVIPGSSDMCDNDIQTDQNSEECDDERVALANLIANLTLDTKENKNILKKLKKATASLTQELKECKSNLEESNTTRDSCLIALHSKQTELETYKTLNDRTVYYDKLERKLNETLGLLSQKEIDIKGGLKLKAYEISVVKEKHDELAKQGFFNKVTLRRSCQRENQDAYNELQCLYVHKVKECKCLAKKLSKQTENVSKEVYNGLLRSFAKLEKHSISLELALQQCQEQLKNDTVCKQNASTVFLKEREQYFEIQDLKAQLQDKNIAIRVIHRTSVSRTQLKSTQMKDTVIQNNSQVKFKKTEVEDHHRISSISDKTKSVTACNDSLKSKISNVNVVCATCGKCVFNSNHDACVSKFIHDVNSRTKKPKIVPISTRKPKSQANIFVATPPKKTVTSESTIQTSKSYYRMLYDKASKAWKWWIAQQCPSRYKWIVQLILYIVDSGCTKHMTGNLKLLCNFLEKYLGTVHFGNDQFALILGYGDLVQGNIMIKRVAFWKSTCFVRDLQGNDLLISNHGSELYTISPQETTSSTPICFMAKASTT
ncbi:retrovirus-related pol polyprotein from transposon TNT 1-94 [Tanacetum coccineum]